MADLIRQAPQSDLRILIMARQAKRNALSRDMIAQLRSALQSAEAEGARSLIIAGDGLAFSAGADLEDLTGAGADESFDDAMWSLTDALRRSPVVSFAAIHGACIGAGLDLAAACDFRVAANHSFFALPAVKMGILYNPRRLSQIAPMLSHAALMRILLLADSLTRDEALAAGFVTHAAHDQADARDIALSLAVASARLPKRAQAAAKDLVQSVVQQGFDHENWQARRRELLNSEERRDALRRARERT